jgi:hypothetical protein
MTQRQNIAAFFLQAAQVFQTKSESVMRPLSFKAPYGFDAR